MPLSPVLGVGALPMRPRGTLSPADDELLVAAESARLNAYAPYSNFLVGAALRTVSGQVIAGANMENASYGLSLCGEAAALSRCVTDTGDLLVESIAIAGAPRSSTGNGAPTMPCGRCRQLLLEAAHRARLDVRVICAFAGAPGVLETRIGILLPFGFGPLDLGANDPGSGALAP
jgi:cytidine deaminase